MSQQYTQQQRQQKPYSGLRSKSLQILLMALLLTFTLTRTQAQIQPGCINNALTNGSFVTASTGPTNTRITGWTQSVTTDANKYWARNGTSSRPGLDAILASVNGFNSALPSYLSQSVSNVAVDNDSITVFVNYRLQNSGSAATTPQLSVYWAPAGSTFDATTHKRAGVWLTGTTSVTSSGYNGAVVKASMNANNDGYLTIRIPNTGGAPASGTLRFLAETHSSTSDFGSASLYSAYIPSNSCTNTPPPVQQPFDCGAGYGYLSQDADGGDLMTVEGRTGLYRVNLASGAATLQYPNLINQTQTDFVQMNALGYNPVDNYLWAFRLGTNQIVRIGSDGSTRFYKVPGLYGSYFAGDIDANGIYYLLDVYTRRIDRINLNTMTLLTPITPGALLKTDVVDLSFNPVDGLIYVASKDTPTSGPVYIQKMDPATGAVTDVFTGPTTTSNFGALYFDNAGNLYGSMNSTGAIWRFTTVAPYQATQLTTGPSTRSNDGARCPVRVAATVNISGKVWNDANGDALTNGTEAGIDPGTLFANLVNDLGNVVASVPVAADGSYSFANVNAVGTYSVILTNTVKTAGSALAASDPLPGTWAHTGTNVGNTPNTSNHTGIITGITTSGNNVTGLDFGIQQPPVADPKTYTLPATPAANSTINLNAGGDNSTGSIPGNLTGTDPEDGVMNGASVQPYGVVINTLPTSGTLIYNGIPITTTNFNIPNYDPSKLQFQFTGSGYQTTSFTYSVVDQAGAVSPAVSYSINWPAAITPTLSGTVYDDGNGDGTVNGTPIQSPNGTPLHANLFTEGGVFVATVPVDASGNYSFPVTANTNYQVTISTTPAASGSTPATSVAAGLPGGSAPVLDWNHTGESVSGDGTGLDATPNGIATIVSVGTTSIQNINFGINQQPSVTDQTADTKPNPTGVFDPANPATSTALSPVTFPTTQGYTGTDLEDGSYTVGLTGEPVTLFPVTTGGILYYDLDGAGPNPPVAITDPAGLVINSFNPANVFIDPAGTGGVNTTETFQYSVQDAAGVWSNPATVTVNFTVALPVTLVSFTAKKGEGNSAALDWATTEETNSDYFEVQHSQDAKNWGILGHVQSKGEGMIRRDYHYTHATPSVGINYYRLKMVDRDGTFAYSSIRNINVSELAKVSLYPNPVSETLLLKDLDAKQVKSLTVINSAGVQVYNSTSNLQSVDISSMPEGLYVLVIKQTGGNQVVKKFIVKK